MASNTTSLTLMKTSLLAGFVGAGVALLLAPTSGKEARSKVRHVASRLQHKAAESTQEAVDSAHAGLDEMSNRIENVQEEMRMRRERKRQSPVLTNWEEEV